MNIYAVDPIANLIGEWLVEINFASICVRLILAVIMGGFLGYERSTKLHPAGLRTHILVCVGAAIASMTNQFMNVLYGADASRIAANIITGIGFLGAGTIMVTSRSKIRGLTTAAGLWCCACVGLCVGTGFYSLAIMGFVIVLLSLQILPFIERMLLNKTRYLNIHVEFSARTCLKDFINYLRLDNIKVIAIEHNPAYSQSGLSVYEITLDLGKKLNKDECNKLINDLDAYDFVEYIERT